MLHSARMKARPRVVYLTQDKYAMESMMNATTLNGPWTKPEVEAFLAQSTIPIRLAAVAQDQFPRVISLWFLYHASSLCCVTHRSSHLARMLGSNSSVGFEISGDSPPYHGIRGQGEAVLTPLGDSPLLRELLLRYVGSLETPFAQWLLSRAEEEMIITISPSRLFSWDYRERMSGP